MTIAKLWKIQLESDGIYGIWFGRIGLDSKDFLKSVEWAVRVFNLIEIHF